MFYFHNMFRYKPTFKTLFFYYDININFIISHNNRTKPKPIPHYLDIRPVPHSTLLPLFLPLEDTKNCVYS